MDGPDTLPCMAAMVQTLHTSEWLVPANSDGVSVMKVLGISTVPVHRQDSSNRGQYIPFIPPTTEPVLPPVPPVPDPLPVNDHAAPALNAAAAFPPAQYPMRPAQPPVQPPPSTDPPVAPVAPATSAQATQPAAHSGEVAADAAPGPGYLQAINNAMRGATTGDHPVLDSANPGPEGYMGSQVYGSVGSASTDYPRLG